MSGRRDRGFYTFRQLCQYLLTLARRCASPKGIPPEDQWSEILELDLKRVAALSVSEFITRIKLGTKLDSACKAKAERDVKDKQTEGLPLDALSGKHKEEFGRAARSYVTHLFNSMQHQTSLTTDLVRGLGSFDLETLLTGSIEHAMYCHRQLFTSFRLRGYFSLDQECPCSEEYRSFVDVMRQTFPDLIQPTLFVKDTVDFLVAQVSLTSRPLLYKLFRLACLCLDEPLPVVTFGSVNTEDPTCSQVDVILPVQSYFRNVPRGVETVTSEQSISKFLLLDPDFGRQGLSDVYCPWLSVDYFGRTKLLEQLDPKGSFQSAPPVDLESESSSGSKAKKKKYGALMKKTTQLLSETELTRSAEDLVAGCSKS